MSQQQPQPRDILADLERHAELLEAQVAKLTQALDHWRLLEAEYEALGDEVNQARTQFAADPQAQKADLVRIRRDFDGQLVDHKTVCELFGARLGQTITRSIDHIASGIGRRLDYVRQNAATLQKQVEAAANRLAAAQVVSRPSMPGGEDGDEDGGFGDDYGPVTDIMEELDDDDNVINVQLHTPSSTQPQVLEALKKAGVEEIPAGGPAEAKKSTEAEEPKAEDQQPQAKQQPKFTPNTSNVQPKPRRGVSFADDTKPGDHNAASSSSSSQPQSFAAQRLENIMRSAQEQESVVKSASAIIPKDETDDDAALRREMLEYSMSEIGPIVAQLDIDEGLSDDDEGYNDDEYDEDDYDDDEEDGEEDQFGRSKYSVIDEAYRERMRELEKKLGVAPLANPSILPTASSQSNGASAAAANNDVAESLGRIRVSGLDAAADASGAPTNGEAEKPLAPTSVLKEPTENFRSKTKAISSNTKKVSFSTALDIAPSDTALTAPEPPTQAKQPVAPMEPLVEPLSDVMERSSSSSKPSAAATAPEPAKRTKKPSRFKMNRGEVAAAAPAAGLPKGPHQAPVRFLDQDRAVAPSGPEGQTVSEAVVERQGVTEPKEPHELDAGILLQEAATDYHRTRNRLIQQQGGFLKASESAIVPVGEDEGGPRISKFKAARLGNQFMSP